MRGKVQAAVLVSRFRAGASGPKGNWSTGRDRLKTFPLKNVDSAIITPLWNRHPPLNDENTPISPEKLKKLIKPPPGKAL